MAGLCWVIYYLISLPLRRQERARFFLDLLEVGFKQGRSPERTVTDIAGTHDLSVGVRFHLLAENIKNGLGFTDALARVPSLAPPHVVAILRVGEKLGDISKVLPVCRGMSRDADSNARNAFNYLLLISLPTLPLLPLVMIFAKTVIVPKLVEIADVYEVHSDKFLTSIAHLGGWFSIAEICVAAVVAIGIVAYVGGPRLQRWLEAGLPPLTNWISYCLPWRRKRLRRDFIAMLSLLLDAGVPEAASVRLAAASTANRVFVDRGDAAVRDLENGKNLAEALRRFDSEEELSWRLANAAHAQGGFFSALSGWMESLDARAFQQEQTVSQIITTCLVVCNGIWVGLMAGGLFYVLTSITNQVALW
jgi:type II secretory pathway component PulF